MSEGHMRFPKALQRPPGRGYHISPPVALAATETDPVTASTPQSSADIYVYDVIGGWFGLTASDFARDVATLDVEQLVVHLNTPGGDAMEGVAIANVLRAHKARVVVRVDGVAASSGSVVAMAGDEIVMGIGSEMMIHEAWGMAVGSAADMSVYARQLDATSNSLAATYAARTGGTVADWRDVMRAETWYTAEEAVTAGLADRVAAPDETGTAEGEQVTPGGSGGFWEMWGSLREPERFDLSAFNYAGRAAAPAPPVLSKQKEGTTVAETFTDDQLETARRELGLADDADETTVAAALIGNLTAQDDLTQVAPALPEGTVAIDSATLAGLQAAAARGEQARTRQEQEDREATVSAAIDDGRIPPARREHWLAQLKADPGSAETLAGLAPGLVPVGAAFGHAGTPDGEDPLYLSLFGKDA